MTSIMTSTGGILPAENCLLKFRILYSSLYPDPNMCRRTFLEREGRDLGGTSMECFLLQNRPPLDFIIVVIGLYLIPFSLRVAVLQCIYPSQR